MFIYCFHINVRKLALNKHYYLNSFYGMDPEWSNPGHHPTAIWWRFLSEANHQNSSCRHVDFSRKSHPAYPGASKDVTYLCIIETFGVCLLTGVLMLPRFSPLHFNETFGICLSTGVLMLPRFAPLRFICFNWCVFIAYACLMQCLYYMHLC